MFVAVAAISFASCGDKTAQSNCCGDSTCVEEMDTTSVEEAPEAGNDSIEAGDSVTVVAEEVAPEA